MHNSYHKPDAKSLIKALRREHGERFITDLRTELNQGQEQLPRHIIRLYGGWLLDIHNHRIIKP